MGPLPGQVNWDVLPLRGRTYRYNR